ncbi:hypothetical protein Tco_1321723 [Tanacetum coccineum]
MFKGAILEDSTWLLTVVQPRVLLPLRAPLSANSTICDTTTIALFPRDMSGFSPATCRWGKVSPTTCRWGILAGEASLGILSPAIIPSDEVGPTHFSVKDQVPRWHTFPQRHVAGESV